MILLVSGILLAMLVVMTLGWAYQRLAGNGGWTDVFWTYGTGLTCAVACLIPVAGWGNVLWRQLLVAAMVLVWSLRLGTYVALRVAAGAEDVRYATLRAEWGRRFQRNMFGVLIVQAPITAVLGIAIVFAAHARSPGPRLADLAGVAILLAAIVGEALADRQMKQFKADPAAAGRVCDRGLWSWSRHPNYFFEVFGWLAYTVMAVTLVRPITLLAVLAPMMMYVVIRFGTGIPPLEAALLRSKGEAYREYQRRVNPLMPWPPKR